MSGWPTGRLLTEVSAATVVTAFGIEEFELDRFREATRPSAGYPGHICFHTSGRSSVAAAIGSAVL